MKSRSADFSQQPWVECLSAPRAIWARSHLVFPAFFGTKRVMETSSGTLQLQLMNTSAYYTYLFLFLTSTVYFVVITSCVFRRTGVCCDGTIS
ncbi:unnamed protein product [Rangifer tarandus platyrhynchus]|uniref:Uncharacterized protein n=1 Tax=Rangifer tarandus platyrhynchus TaxID=3082113 RepID=A0AC59YQQ6_RANTA